MPRPRQGPARTAPPAGRRAHADPHRGGTDHAPWLARALQLTIAGHCATTPDGQLALRGMVFTRDGGEFVHAMEWGPVAKPAELGAYLAGLLLRKGARDLIAGI